MNKTAEMTEMEKASIALHAKLIDAGFLPSCINCDHFTDEELCSIYNARPPAKVITLGCEEWIIDIPF